MICTISEIYKNKEHRRKDSLNALVLSEIFEHPGLSRKEITGRFHLRPSSVSQACQELLDQGLITESNPVDSNQRGRPEVALHPVRDHWVAACVFMESLDFRAVFIDVTGRITPVELPNFRDSKDGYQERLDRVLKKVVASRPEQSSFIGIGLSLPGFGVPEEHEWVTTTRFGNLRQPASHPANESEGYKINWLRSIDARGQALLLSTPRYKQGKTVLFHWGYGISVTFSMDGKILNDSFSRFGELGHTIVNPRGGKKCRCGAEGCLETEAAMWALLPSLEKRFHQVPENEREFSAFLTNRFIEEIPEIESALDYINIGLVNISKLLSPDRILFYGPFTDKDSIYRKVREKFYSNIPEAEFGEIEIDRISHTPADEVIGATHSLFLGALRKDLRARG